MLTFDFFAYLEPLTRRSILAGGPPDPPQPGLRRPSCRQAADQWRASGGTLAFQLPAIPGIFGGG